MWSASLAIDDGSCASGRHFQRVPAAARLDRRGSGCSRLSPEYARHEHTRISGPRWTGGRAPGQAVAPWLSRRLRGRPSGSPSCGRLRSDRCATRRSSIAIGRHHGATQCADTLSPPVAEHRGARTSRARSQPRGIKHHGYTPGGPARMVGVHPWWRRVGPDRTGADSSASRNRRRAHCQFTISSTSGRHPTWGKSAANRRAVWFRVRPGPSGRHSVQARPAPFGSPACAAHGSAPRR
jgi:hypothetical protein